MLLRPPQLRPGEIALLGQGDEDVLALLRARTVVVRHDSLLVRSWNHTMILIDMPEGVGSDHDVIVDISGQESAPNEDIRFTYNPPVVYGWRRTGDRAAEECLPRLRCDESGTRCRE